MYRTDAYQISVPTALTGLAALIRCTARVGFPRTLTAQWTCPAAGLGGAWPHGSPQGAAGTLGLCLRAHLVWGGGAKLMLLDVA